jgi:hypothetical protein
MHDDIMQAGAEMPRYRCHKIVHALKIRSVVHDRAAAMVENRVTDGSAIITPDEPGYAPFKVDRAYVEKHNPSAAGYYVVYDDGYASWSPDAAFEAGYTRI